LSICRTPAGTVPCVSRTLPSTSRVATAAWSARPRASRATTRKVLRVHAPANQPVQKGDLLLEINPAPYPYTVNQAPAQLNVANANVEPAQAGLQAAADNVAQARAGVAQAQAARDEAQAAVANAQATPNKAKAADELSRTEEPIARNLQKMDAGAISTLRVAQAVPKRQEADAAVKPAEAGLTQARASRRQAEAGVTAAPSAWQQAQAAERQATFAVQGAEGNVPAVQAQLGDARFHLAQGKVLAPADGYGVNGQVQEGTMLVSVPLAPAGTFLSTAETALVAAFPPNYLMNVGPGDEGELVRDPYPGRLFQGKVDTVITASGSG
jgi:multidrug resistance efflux pump